MGSWIEQRNIQRYLKPAYSLNLDLGDYEAFHAQKRATVGKHIPLSINFKKPLIKKLHMENQIIDMLLSIRQTYENI